MSNEDMDEWREKNKFVSKLSEEGQKKLYQELKRSGSVEVPIMYKETHLKGGIEDELEDK